MKLIKIAIVDDHPTMINGLIKITSDLNTYEIIWTANSLKESNHFIEKGLIPDLAILDISYPDGDGFILSEKLLQKNSDIKIIFLSMNNQFDFIVKALKSGCQGYITKDCTEIEIKRGLEEVSNGRYHFSQNILGVITQIISNSGFNSFIPDSSPYNLLTDREKAIFNLLLKQNTVKEIAFELNIKSKTVFTHKQNIYKKLSLQDQRDLIHFAEEIGLK